MRSARGPAREREGEAPSEPFCDLRIQVLRGGRKGAKAQRRQDGKKSWRSPPVRWADQPYPFSSSLRPFAPLRPLRQNILRELGERLGRSLALPRLARPRRVVPAIYASVGTPGNSALISFGGLIRNDFRSFVRGWSNASSVAASIRRMPGSGNGP